MTSIRSRRVCLDGRVQASREYGAEGSIGRGCGRGWCFDVGEVDGWILEVVRWVRYVRGDMVRNFLGASCLLADGDVREVDV